jgi:HK97 family phage prohead protease
MNRFEKFNPLALEVKDIDSKNRIGQAYYFSAGTLDSDNDIIEPGAYAKSIAERGPKSSQPRIKHLFNHWDAAGVLMDLQEDKKGGYFTSKLSRSDIGRNLLLMYEDGVVTEHSHGFEVVNSHISTIEGKDVRHISEGVLWEVTSLDKWGANHRTPVKSIEERNFWATKINALVDALKKGKYTDDFFEVLQIQLMQIQEMVRTFEPDVKSTPPKEPDVRTTQSVDYSKILFNSKNQKNEVRI